MAAAMRLAMPQRGSHRVANNGAERTSREPSSVRCRSRVQRVRDMTGKVYEVAAALATELGFPLPAP